MADSLNETPVASRVHISIFGRRNAGKSSLINALTGQPLAVISDVPGTTTDPVHKTMELLPVGPVVVTDTAGLDDTGELGALRVEKTYEVLRRTDLAVVVASAAEGVTEFERSILGELKKREIPALLVLNKTDEAAVSADAIASLGREFVLPVCAVSAKTGEGVAALREHIAQTAKTDDAELSLVEGLVRPGEVAVLVTPIDKAAPKGRLILPQQQTIRDLLECDAVALVTKEQELCATLDRLREPPAVVITDSQAFLKVSADTPEEVPLTSFSILFARQKGDLAEMARGVRAVSRLRPGARVLIVEGCTPHRQSDDIGTVKLPRWLRQFAGGELQFQWASGASFPRDVSGYDIVIHCGGCMLNHREMQYRIREARAQGVPVTNYGLVIAHVQGILERALRPFPDAHYALAGE